MATTDNDAMSPSFDPYTQTLTLLTPNAGPIPIPIPDIDDYVTYAVGICINYASQIGASLILLVILLLTTRPDKRTTAIFALNALALLFNTIRSICQCVYFTGQFNEFYTYFSGDYSRVPAGQYGASVTSSIFTLFVLFCIEGSLALQVRCLIATPTVQKLHQRLIFTACIILALLAIAFRLALAIENIRAILAAADFTSGIWLEKAAAYTTAISIVFFSFIFTAKLGFALYRRRSTLSQQHKSFGPMEIVFVMGCQTMIIPAVFAILQSFVNVPELRSQMLTVTALFLPVSSLWATANVENGTRQRDGSGNEGLVHKVKSTRGFLGSLLARVKRAPSDVEASDSSMRPLKEMTGTTATATTARLSSETGTPMTKHERGVSESTTVGMLTPSPLSAQKDRVGMRDDGKDALDSDFSIYVGRSFGVSEQKPIGR